jgi:hypothetical protein
MPRRSLKGTQGCQWKSCWHQSAALGNFRLPFITIIDSAITKVALTVSMIGIAFGGAPVEIRRSV